MSNPSDIKLSALTMLSMRPVLRRMRHWWYSRAEEHYMICAAVEHARAREAEDNEAYYQIRAAMARAELRYD